MMLLIVNRQGQNGLANSMVKYDKQSRFAAYNL
jgi:hypothetical protein